MPPPGRIRTGPSPDRKNPQGTSRIQNPAHVFLPFGLRNPQKLRSGRLHLLPADRHTAQSPPFSGHRPPRNRHLRQIRILDQPAHRACAAARSAATSYRPSSAATRSSSAPTEAIGAWHSKVSTRSSFRTTIPKITGRTGLRQRRSRRRHPLRPGCRNCGCGEKIDLIERFKGGTRLLIAGSTWGPDEDLLIRLINDNPSVKFIVAPHEMDESRINRLLAETLGGACPLYAMHRRNIVRWQTTARSRYGRYSLLGLRLCRMGLYRRRIRRRHPQHARSRHVRSADRFRPQLRKIQGSPRPGNARSGNAHPLIRRIENLVHPLRDDEHLLQQCKPASPKTTRRPTKGRRTSSCIPFSESRNRFFVQTGRSAPLSRQYRFRDSPCSAHIPIERINAPHRLYFLYKKAHRPQGRHACYFSRGYFEVMIFRIR